MANFSPVIVSGHREKDINSKDPTCPLARRTKIIRKGKLNSLKGCLLKERWLKNITQESTYLQTKH